MNENILTACGRSDETKSFGLIEKLNCTFLHSKTIEKINNVAKIGKLNCPFETLSGFGSIITYCLKALGASGNLIISCLVLNNYQN
jgi:hypothetical protein